MGNFHGVFENESIERMGMADYSMNGADEAKTKMEYTKMNIYHHETYPLYDNTYNTADVIIVYFLTL